jgi:hypothetical protein
LSLASDNDVGVDRIDRYGRFILFVVGKEIVIASNRHFPIAAVIRQRYR